MYINNNFAYYDTLRKNNPAQFYSLKSMKQMQDDCNELGLSAFLTTREDQANDLRW